METPGKVTRRKQEVFECFEEELSEVQVEFYGKAQKEHEDFLAKFYQNFGNRPDIMITKRDPCYHVEYFSTGVLAPIPANGSVLQAAPPSQILLLNRGINLNSSVPPLILTGITPSISTTTPISINTPTTFTSPLIVTTPKITKIKPATSAVQSVTTPKSTPKSSLTPSSSKRPIDKSGDEDLSIVAKRLKPIGTINVVASCDVLTESASKSDQQYGETDESGFSSGRTYPSLVVRANPCLRPPNDPSHKTDKINLENRMRKILSYAPDKFTEWLIQVGLVRTDHFCPLHKDANNDLVKLKLGMYTESQKFPFSGGYVWISDCCPQQYVSLFAGSLFESSSFPPQTSLKLMYHWANHTSIQNIMQWMSIPNLFIKNLYTNLRAICTAAVHEHMEKLGGSGVNVQVAVLSLGFSKGDSNLGKVKVEILAALEPARNLIRLRAIDPTMESTFHTKFNKIFEILPSWIDKSSNILVDDTIYTKPLFDLGFLNVSDAPVIDKNGVEVQPNDKLVKYLRCIIPKMFSNTLSVLSRVVIQRFLDELVWRECFGYYPAKAFESICMHLIEQTKLNTGGTLCNRLSKISSNPFKDWKYSRWKANCSWRPTNPPAKIGSVGKNVISKQKVKPVAMPKDQPSVMPHRVTSKVIVNSAGLAQIVNVASPILQSPTPLSSPSALKQIKVINQTPLVQSPELDPALVSIVEDISNPNIAKILLEPYYYGKLKGNSDFQFLDIDLQVPCYSCRKLFTSNLSMTDHLIHHAINPVLVGEPKEICKACLKIVSNKLLLQQHYSQCHSDLDSYSPKTTPKCLICNIKYRDVPSLISHMTSTHYELELPYICQVCNFRTSIFYEMLNHITEAHDRDDTVFCPYCYKVYHLLQSGLPSQKNQFAFIFHIRKHQLSLNRKCSKCHINCTNKTTLMDHEIYDHKSISKDYDVDRFLTEDTLMPAPLSDPPSPKMERYRLSLGGPYKILSTLRVTLPDEDIGKYCIECESKMGSDHYLNEVLCMKCEYNTYCARAMNAHFICAHGSSGFPISHVPTTYDRTLYCACSFSTTDGNSMAQHLVHCKKETAYLVPAVSACNSSLKSIMDEDCSL